MADLSDLQQRVEQAWADALHARHDARKAYLLATHAMQQAQRAVQRAQMASLQLSMPGANPLALAITAALLTSHGLLDEKPTLRPLWPATGGRR